MGATLLNPYAVAAAAPAVTPADVAGLIGWFAGDTITDPDGSSVTSWTDGSSFASHGTQATSGARPAVKTGGNGINGHNVVRFDGVNDFLITAMPTDTKPFTCVAVVKMTTLAGYGAILAGNTGGLEWRIDQSSGVQSALSQATALIGSSSSAVVVGTAAILVCQYSGTGVWKFYKNGGAPDTGTTDLTFAAASSTIGALASADEPIGADLAELAKWDSVLSLANLNAQCAALGTKYAITWTPAT